MQEAIHMTIEKMLVVSDIHGALSGARAVIEAAEHHQTERILCLGDILYHGPRNDVPADYAPKKVIEIMNSLKDRIIAVRGNCDAEVDQMVLSFPVMSDTNTLYLGNRRLVMSHGHVYGPDHLPFLSEGDIFLSGHTHVPTAYYRDGICLLNPGSVSLPKQNYPASYGVIDESGFTVFDLQNQPFMSVSWR